MDQVYYIWFCIFGIILFLFFVDKNVAHYYILWTKILRLWVAKTKWWILYNPENPIIKYMIRRNSYKLAKQLQKELKNESNKG